MKGIVFREFTDFVEAAAGDDVADEMIARADLPSGAAYTTVGKYDWREMASLVSALSEITSVPVADLLRAFGRHLFGQLRQAYPQIFNGRTTAFDVLTSVEDDIHVEVLKLYPDAELPSLDVSRLSPDELSVRYTSCRPFGDLCIGMIEGCGEYFGESFEIAHEKRDDGLDIRVRKVQRKAA